MRRNVQECTRNIQTGRANSMQKYIGNLRTHEQFGSELTLTYLSILTDIDLPRRYTNSVQVCTRMYQQYAEILTSILLKSVSTRSMASTPKALACVTKLCRAKSTSRASLVLTPPACVFSCMLCVCVRGGVHVYMCGCVGVSCEGERQQLEEATTETYFTTVASGPHYNHVTTSHAPCQSGVLQYL